MEKNLLLCLNDPLDVTMVSIIFFIHEERFQRKTHQVKLLRANIIMNWLEKWVLNASKFMDSGFDFVSNQNQVIILMGYMNPLK